MYPVLFRIGPFTVHSFGLMLGIAFIVASAVLTAELRRKKLNPELASPITILAIFGARTIGQQPGLLQDPDALSQAVKDNLLWIILLVVGLGAGWMFVKWFGKRKAA